MRLPGITVKHELTDDDWYTPKTLFDALGVTFDIDVAAPPGGVSWIPATRYYTEQDDGLDAPWDGSIWMNPPYSKPKPWVERMAREHTEGIALVPADCSTSWWQTGAKWSELVCLIRGRMVFVQPGNQNVTSAPFPSCLFVNGYEYVDAVRRADLGWCSK